MRLQYDPKLLRRVSAAREFGRVAVLFGGDSSEREISLLSGQAVLEALRRRGVDAHAFDPRDQSLSELLAQRFERVWIALHGPGGEDGTLQGALDYLGVPYTGSGVMGSANTSCSNAAAAAKAAASSSGRDTLVIPTLEPWVAGLMMRGSPSRSIARAKSPGPPRVRKSEVGTPIACARRLVRSLSMPIAEPMTPLPV